MANNPYPNKIIYYGVVKLDLTDATVTANKMAQGYTAYGADGAKVTGTATERSSSDLTVSGNTVNVPNGFYSSDVSKVVPVVTYYTGSTAPSSSLGSDGDIYLET